MSQKYLIFIGLILGAVIIGGFVFAAMVYVPHGQNSYSVASKHNTQSVKVDQVAVATCQASANTIVTKVIDGDTVVVAGGYHVRLLGMDADEKNYPCYDAAKVRLEDLVLNKEVVLEKDVTDIDQYGRCLRTIFLGNDNIDVQLVKEGLAVARFYQPDVKYRAEISAAEQQAMSSKAGCKWKH